MFHRLTCPVCNPFSRMRTKKFLAEVDATGHIEWAANLVAAQRREVKSRR